jgi:hypothetical protein
MSQQMRTAESPGRKITARPANHHAHISMAARKAERAHICELLRERIDGMKEINASPEQIYSAIERLIAVLMNTREQKGNAQ